MTDLTEVRKACRNCGRDITVMQSAMGDGEVVTVHTDTRLCSCAGWGRPWAEAEEPAS